MHSINAVKVGHRFSNLFKNTTGCGLSHDSIYKRFGVLLQGDAFNVVSDYVDLFWRIDQVMKLDNSWVLQTLQYCDLSLSCLFLHRILQAILFVDFYRILLLVALIKAEPDCSIGTLSNDPTKVVRLKLTTSLRTSRHVAGMNMSTWLRVEQIILLRGGGSSIGGHGRARTGQGTRMIDTSKSGTATIVCPIQRLDTVGVRDSRTRGRGIRVSSLARGRLGLLHKDIGV